MSCRYDETEGRRHFGNQLAPGFFADHREDSTIHYCAHTDAEGFTLPKVTATVPESVASAEPEAESETPTKRRRRDA